MGFALSIYSLFVFYKHESKDIYDMGNITLRQNSNPYIHNNKSVPFRGEKAVLFDMDGVIVNSDPYHRPAWFEFSQKYNPGLTKEQVSKIMHGRTNQDIIPEIIGKELSNQEIDKYSEEKELIYQKLIEPEIKEVKGFTPFVKSLGRMKRSIATSAPPMNIDFVLTKLGIAKYFDKSKIVDASMVIKGKPDPEVYLKAAEKLGVEPADCLVFEDSPSGVKAAKNAGMKVVGVATTISTDRLTNELQTDFAINDFTEINLDKVNEILDKDKDSLFLEKISGVFTGICTFFKEKVIVLIP